MTNHDHPAKVASLIASEEEGVAKNAAIVFVPMMAGQTLEVPIRYILQALKAIIADVKAKKLQGKAVINMSITLTATQPRHDNIQPAVQGVLNEAVALGIIIVAAAGNAGAWSEIDNAAAIWKDLYMYYHRDPIIVTGALDENRQRDGKSQGYLGSDIWAPGEVEWNHDIFEGTSFAAGRISGLAAYFLSTLDCKGDVTKRSQQIKDLLVELARRDFKYGPLIADNGIKLYFPHQTS